VLASPIKKTGDNMQQTFTTTALATILGGLCVSAVPSPRAACPTRCYRPAKAGLDAGLPPAPDKLVQFANGSSYQFPRTRWSFSHSRELGLTNVWHGAGYVAVLPQALQSLDDLRFKDGKNTEIRWADMLANTYTDSVLVMHKGR
jgi:hypothetical protein